MTQEAFRDLVKTAETESEFRRVMQEAVYQGEKQLYKHEVFNDELAHNDDLRLYILHHCFAGDAIQDRNAESLLLWMEYNGVDPKVMEQIYETSLKNILSDTPASKKMWDQNYENLSNWLDKYNVSDVLAKNPEIVDKILEKEALYPVEWNAYNERHRERVINGLIANGVSEKQIADGFTKAALNILEKAKQEKPGVENIIVENRLMGKKNLSLFRAYGANVKAIVEAAVPAVEKGNIRYIDGMINECRRMDIPKDRDSLLYHFSKNPGVFYDLGTIEYNKQYRIDVVKESFSQIRGGAGTSLRGYEIDSSELYDHIENYLENYDRLPKDDQIPLQSFAYELTVRHYMDDNLADMFAKRNVSLEMAGYQFKQPFQERESEFKTQVENYQVGNYVRFQDLSKFDVSDVIQTHPEFIKDAINEAWLTNDPAYADSVYQGLKQNNISDQEIKQAIQNQMIAMSEMMPEVIEGLYNERQQIVTQATSPEFADFVAQNPKVQEMVAYAAWSIETRYLKDKALHDIKDIVPPDIVEKTYKMKMENFGEKIQKNQCLAYNHGGLLDHFDDYDMKDVLMNSPALFDYCALRAECHFEDPDHPMMQSLVKYGFSATDVRDRAEELKDTSVPIGKSEEPENSDMDLEK